MININKYTGCFLGLAMGDACGAPFEGGPVERLLWRIIGKTKDGKLRYTDDTQMAMDLAMSFIQNNGINQDHLAAAFGDSYRWSRGYGPSAAWLLKKIKNGANWRDVNRAKFKDGSFGNGAAMRAPILAMLFPEDTEQLNANIIACSEITHAHPAAMEGARLIALTARSALRDWSTEAIAEALPTWCRSDEYLSKVTFCIESIQAMDALPVNVLKRKLGNGMAASHSCVTAIYFALKYRNQFLNDMLTQICNLGGDADTIGAMAGAIWGAFNGSAAIDADTIKRIENAATIIELSEQIHAMVYSNPPVSA